MRIVIAEDELIERKALRKFIEEHFSDLQVVGEAINGRKAIELAKTLQPDLMFMDIKMPGINGLEAIEQIQAIQPTIKFILVSAYDSFDFAKEAIRYGVKDYILKPGKKEETVQAILRVKKELEAEALREQEEASKVSVIKQHLLHHLIQGQWTDEAERMWTQHFPAISHGCFFVLKGKTPLHAETIEPILAQQSYTWLLQTAEDSAMICLLATEPLENPALLQLARSLHLALGDTIYIGIGTQQKQVKHFAHSYQQAFSACMQLSAQGSRRYGFWQVETNREANDVFPALLQAIEKGNAEQARLLYQENNPHWNSFDREELYVQIRNLLHRKQLNSDMTSIQALQKDQDWFNFLELCCMKLKTFHESHQFAEKVKSYINEHFQTAITLEAAAQAVQLSPNYFSNLFKQEFGQTFTDYVTSVRMEKAKQLIEANQYSLKEISFQLGYRDPNYFSRVFKRHFSESPTAFQRGLYQK